MIKSNLDNISKKAYRRIGSALMQVALLSGCFSLGGSATTYSTYAGRRGNYTGRRNQSYLVDEGLGALSRDLLGSKVSLFSHNENYPCLTAKDTEVVTGRRVTELLIVDRNVRDYHRISAIAKPGMEVVELPEDAQGLTFLLNTLQGYNDLSAVHLFSHASAGQLHLGKEQVDIEDLKQSNAFAVINKAIRAGGDLLLYGCELAKGKEGDDLWGVFV